MNPCIRPGRRILPLCATALLAGCAPAITVMSLNVRYPAAEDAQTWEMRRPVMAGAIARTKPDLIGTQELFARQGDDLVRALPQYRWIGRDRYGAHGDEHMGIFYRTRRMVLEEQGDFWLSQTPDQPGSLGRDTDLPRMVTWARFHLRAHPERKLVMLNTHFPHRDQDDAARTRAAQLIVARLASICAGGPIVLTADLNSTPGSAAYAVLTSVLRDAGPNHDDLAKNGTFHDFTGKADRRIDYIMVDGLRGGKAQVLHDRAKGIYPSDHFPVAAKLFFQGRSRPRPCGGAQPPELPRARADGSGSGSRTAACGACAGGE